MKIVTYNVKGLRPRIAQFGSLFKLLNSLDADFICFQETKLRRQELTAELAEGYESFPSRTGTSGRGRTGYSDNCLVWRRFVARSGRSRVTKSLCRRQRRNALPGFLTVEREK